MDLLERIELFEAVINTNLAIFKDEIIKLKSELEKEKRLNNLIMKSKNFKLAILFALIILKANAQWVVNPNNLTPSPYYFQPPPTGYIQVQFTDRDPLRTVSRAKWSQGDFVGKVQASDPDTDLYHPNYLVYSIRSGNSDYGTFGFGPYKPAASLWQVMFPPKDTTGKLFVWNIKGIYDSQGQIRLPKYDLIVRVTDRGGLWAEAHIYVLIDPKTGELRMELMPFASKLNSWQPVWK